MKLFSAARSNCRAVSDCGAVTHFGRRPVIVPWRDRLDGVCRNLPDPSRADRSDGDRLGSALAGSPRLGTDLGAPRPRRRVRIAAAFPSRRLCDGSAGNNLCGRSGTCRHGEHYRRRHSRAFWHTRLHALALAGWSISDPGAVAVPVAIGLVLARRCWPRLCGRFSAAGSTSSIDLPGAWARLGRQDRRRCSDAAGRAARYLPSAGTRLGCFSCTSVLGRQRPEAWVALRLAGATLGFPAVLVIESLLYAARSAAFAVPNAFGVQEGAYVLLGAGLGLTPEMGLALSLLKRARDLTIGLPALSLATPRKRPPAAPVRRRPPKRQNPGRDGRGFAPARRTRGQAPCIVRGEHRGGENDATQYCGNFHKVAIDIRRVNHDFGMPGYGHLGPMTADAVVEDAQRRCGGPAVPRIGCFAYCYDPEGSQRHCRRPAVSQACGFTGPWFQGPWFHRKVTATRPASR